MPWRYHPLGCVSTPLLSPAHLMDFPQYWLRDATQLESVRILTSDRKSRIYPRYTAPDTRRQAVMCAFSHPNGKRGLARNLGTWYTLYMDENNAPAADTLSDHECEEMIANFDLDCDTLDDARDWAWEHFNGWDARSWKNAGYTQEFTLRSFLTEMGFIS